MSGFHLKIESRGRQKQLYPIPNDLYRIGSDVSCQVRIACRSEHALTLFRRQGQYSVVNRTEQPLRISGRSLRPAATAEWPAGKRLTVEGVTLTLRANQASPASATTPRPGGSGQAEGLSSASSPGHVDTTNAAGNKGKKKRSQYTVIVTCLSLIIAMQWVVAGEIGQHSDTDFRFQSVAKSLSGMVSQSESSTARSRRVTTLLDLVSQYRLAVTLDEPENLRRARSEVITFCHSLNCTTRISLDEQAVAREVLLLMN